MASPGLLFLHGLAGHGGEWAAVCSELGDASECSTPDLRGHGRRSDVTDMSAASFVDDAVVVIDNEFGGRPVIVVGQSMGGILATRLTASRPDLVTGLVLIESGMEAIGSHDLEKVKAWLDNWPLRFADRESARSFFGGSDASSNAWADGLETSDGGLRPRFDAGVVAEALTSLALMLL